LYLGIVHNIQIKVASTVLKTLRGIEVCARIAPLVGCVEFWQYIILLPLGKRPMPTSSVNGVQLKLVEFADGTTEKFSKTEGGD
jgi:hypothetical protein